MNAVPGVKKMIAIASGKGGVGKSTTAVNLALALAKLGQKVGILDADVYGPNQPHLLGVANARPQSLEDNRLMPVMAHGLQIMSIGFLVDPETPMIWRGPMISTALHQLLYDTQWQDVDCLVVDLPPGTGDVQLTLAQKMPVNGVVMVTTPQDIALLDVRKAVAMFQKVKVPIFGVVENMSTHICSQCGHEEALFGSGGGEKLSKQYGMDFLGSIPLDLSIREHSDNGTPVEMPVYLQIANQVLTKLNEQPKDYSSKFPKIVIEHTK